MTHISFSNLWLPAILIFGIAGCNTFHELKSEPPASNNLTNNATSNATNNTTNGSTNNTTSGELVINLPGDECFQGTVHDDFTGSSLFLGFGDEGAEVAIVQENNTASAYFVKETAMNSGSLEGLVGFYKSWLIEDKLHALNVICAETSTDLRWTNDFRGIPGIGWSSTPVDNCMDAADIELQGQGEGTFPIWRLGDNLYTPDRGPQSMEWTLDGLFGTTGTYAVFTSLTGSFFWHPVTGQVVRMNLPTESSTLAATHLDGTFYMTLHAEPEDLLLRIWSLNSTAANAHLISTATINQQNPKAASFFRLRNQDLVVTWVDAESDDGPMIKVLLLSVRCDEARCLAPLEPVAYGTVALDMFATSEGEDELQTALTEVVEDGAETIYRFYALLTTSPTAPATQIIYASWPKDAECQ